MKKLMALLLTAAMLAGCVSPSNGQEASDGTGRTYVDPDPDMVFASLPSGDVTYGPYRLYIDINERMERDYAKENIALIRMIEKDLEEWGIAVDEAEINMQASQVMLQNYAYEEFAGAVELVMQAMGADADQMMEILMLDSRMQVLVGMMQEHYYTLAEEKYPAPAQETDPSGSGEEASSEPEQAASSSEPEQAASSDAAAEEEAEQLLLEEQERLYSIQQELETSVAAYYDSILTRCVLDADDGSISVDGERIELSELENAYMDYVGMITRYSMLNAFRAAEAMEHELEQKGLLPDQEEYGLAIESFHQQILDSEEYMAELDGHLEALGATREDYFQVVERPMWLTYIDSAFSEMVYTEYEALPEDDESKPETADEYYSQRLLALLGDGELMNITGKPDEPQASSSETASEPVSSEEASLDDASSDVQ